MDYQVKYKDLADRVMQLLDKQKEYFKTRNRTTLSECKKLETNLYQECKEIVYGKKKISTSQTLFGVDVNEHGMTTKDFLT